MSFIREPKKQLEAFRINTEGITLFDPLGYLAFLQLESKAILVMTDSGGVQEEACILGVPCITLRDNTERAETVDVGSNILAGTNPDEILQSAKNILAKRKKGNNPFGSGETGQIIMSILVGSVV